MKNTRFLALSAAAMIALSSMTVFVHGDEKTYDAENDPLISLSYLNGVFAPTYDKKITDATAKITALETKLTAAETKLTETNKKLTDSESTISASSIKITQLEEKLANLETKVAELTHEMETAEATGYEVICLLEGEKLLALSPLEIILRSGSAVTVSAVANGVNDLTGGTELMDADAVPLYHQLLVPRGNDGRGIEVTSAEAYIMVRGAYEIIN